MAGRCSFKTDEGFFEKLAIGAVSSHSRKSAIGICHSTLPASAFRFVDEPPAEELATLWSRLHSDDLPVETNRRQSESVLREKPTAYATRLKRK